MSTRRDYTASDGWFVGEDKGLVTTITTAQGVAINITGWTIGFEFTNVQYGHEILSKTATLLDPTNGVCAVVIDSADTIALAPTTPDGPSYFYTLRRIDTGFRTEIQYGAVDLLDTWTDNP